MDNLTNPMPDENKTPGGFYVRGIDLKIDDHTQILCQSYSSSSGATRSVLYILLLINIISLIAVFNSNWKYNWTNDRIARCTRDLKDANNRLPVAIAKLTSDSTAASERHKRGKLDFKAWNPIYANDRTDVYILKDKIEELRKKREDLEKATIENFYMIKVNFIGVAFDINDLAPITGLSMIVLLVVLRFTETREKNNLRLAFNSISERYADDSDKDSFIQYEELIIDATAAKDPAKPKPAKGAVWPVILKDINFVRRRYHYNFLSMNEVFNLPKISISQNVTQTKFIGILINKYMFYFPMVIYSLILFNDFTTVEAASKLEMDHTWISVISSCICFIYISNLCNTCAGQKLNVIELFKNFYEKNYTYDHGNYEPDEHRLEVRIFVPVVLLFALFGFAKLLIFLIGA
jgi:hypothetical protein